MWIDFSPIKGREQSGLRPAIVISQAEYNAFTGLVLACPITSKGKGYFFEIAVDGPKTKSFALADQIRSFDIKSRIQRTTGKVSDSEMNEILSKLSVLIQ